MRNLRMDIGKTVTIMLVEDDPGDQKLIRTALMGQGYEINLVIASCGESAINYLQMCKEDSEKYQRPCLILLDLNMPGMGGKEFLRKIKVDNELCAIPVVVVTTSDSETDIRECYELQAAGYIQKSAVPKDFRDILEKLTHYWFSLSAMFKSNQIVAESNN
jgi:CheY-like chemotaxis protein